MKKLIVLIVTIFLVSKGWSYWQEEMNVATAINPHDEVIMYSLTTCGYCKAKAKELKANNIDFIEYYIDKDRARKTELNEKMKAAGIRPGGIGTPILDVKGVVLPNNPSLEKIRRYL